MRDVILDVVPDELLLLPDGRVVVLRVELPAGAVAAGAGPAVVQVFLGGEGAGAAGGRGPGGRRGDGRVDFLGGAG